MEALKKAIAEVKEIERRFHELVDPEKAMRDAIFGAVQHAGAAIVAIGERVEALGAAMEGLHARVQMNDQLIDGVVAPLVESAQPEKPAATAPEGSPAAPVPQDAEPAAAVSDSPAPSA